MKTNEYIIIIYINIKHLKKIIISYIFFVFLLFYYFLVIIGMERIET